MLATDGSEFSRAPTEIAIALARCFGVTLDIVTSVEAEGDREAAHARLAAAVRDAHVAGVDCEERIRVGKQPVREVVTAAASADTNILVIGRRPARGDIKERLLGDVARHILAQAPSHVLIAGWQSRMWNQRILLASDGSDLSDAALELTAQIARATGTPVTLVAAITSARGREQAEEDLAHKAGLLRLEAVDCDTRIVEGSPGAAIAQVAGEIGADLVVVGNERRKGLDRVVASATDQVIGNLSCAVLVVNAANTADTATATVARDI
jgi:SulP family sulfate permease